MDQDYILALSSLLPLLAPCSLHRHTHQSGTVIFYHIIATSKAYLYTKKVINTLDTEQ